MRVAIVTDSTADLTQEEVAEYGIRVVPLTIAFGSEMYLDGVDISTQAFYEKMAAAKELPTTSQPSAGSFADAFRVALHSYDAVVGIFISGNLSGTIRSAETAKTMVDGDITLVDSQTTTAALAMQVLGAAQLAARGFSPSEIVRRVEEVRQRTEAYIVVESLENLRRGGRIGGAAALVGSLLQIKPVIHLRDGRVDVFERVRTYRRAVDTVLERFRVQVAGCKNVQATVIYSDGCQFDDMRQRVAEIAPAARIRVTYIGSVVGVHAGSGSIGLVSMAE